MDDGSKRAKLDFSSSDDDSDEIVVSVEPSKQGLFTFNPFYTISFWEERCTTTKRLSVAINLHSGVGVNDFKLGVLESHLEMVCQKPEELSNIETLHRKWIVSDKADHLDLNHPKLPGFDAFLKSLRRRRSDSVSQKAKIPFPFEVESHINAFFTLGFCEAETRIVYVYLRAPVEEYGTIEGNPTLEIS